jgi:hypothetical protein
MLALRAVFEMVSIFAANLRDADMALMGDEGTRSI